LVPLFVRSYQRTLHRDLMEMAQFIDSMFGVYGNSNRGGSSKSLTANSTVRSVLAVERRLRSHWWYLFRWPQSKRDVLEPRVIDLTAEPADGGASSLTEEKPAQAEQQPAHKSQQGALMRIIEAEEKDRVVQRSKEQWIKSRHQVLEEEGVSAIMGESASGMLEAASADSAAADAQQGAGGVALANQLRAHQHIAAFMKASQESAAACPPPNLLLTNQLIIPVATQALAVPANAQLKPNSVGAKSSKIALPPAHSMMNMLFAFPGAPLMFNPQAAGGMMPMVPWQPQFQAPLPARAAMPARPPGEPHPSIYKHHTTTHTVVRTAAKAPKLKRICESCRKRHISARQCRLVLQHTAPEWQPAQPSPAVRRRRRKQPDPSTQVT
jgi:hypothetical protein